MLLAVTASATMETMSLNHTLEALALTDSGNLYSVAYFKFLKFTQRNLSEVGPYFFVANKITFFLLGFIHSTFFLHTISNLQCLVTIFFKSFILRNNHRQSLNDSYGLYPTRGIEHLGHILFSSY